MTLPIQPQHDQCFWQRHRFWPGSWFWKGRRPCRQIIGIILSIVGLQAAAAGHGFGGWEFLEINHDFDETGFYITSYLEHDNYEYNAQECAYARFLVGYRVLSWLKAGVNYVPLYEPGHWKNYFEGELKASYDWQDFTFQLRERYRFCSTNSKNELRTRLKLSYHIPETAFSPYVAAEVFTWDGAWLKTRHYVACCYDLNDHVQFECYYLYYAIGGTRDQHVIGVGLNLDL